MRSCKLSHLNLLVLAFPFAAPLVVGAFYFQSQYLFVERFVNDSLEEDRSCKYLSKGKTDTKLHTNEMK